MTDQQNKLIGELYVEMFDMLLDIARVNSENEALAEEAVHDTFCLACSNPEKICESPNPRGWLVLALRNIIHNTQKNRFNAQRIVERYLVVQEQERAVVFDRTDTKVLYANVADTEEFKLLWEMAVIGMSHKELAEARGISVVACKKRVERAKKVLQRRLGVNDPS